MDMIVAIAIVVLLVTAGVLCALGRTPDTRDSRYSAGRLLDR
jgi:hypothetical protein